MRVEGGFGFCGILLRRVVEMGFLWGGEEGGVFLYMALHWCGAVYYGFFFHRAFGMLNGEWWVFVVLKE